MVSFLPRENVGVVVLANLHGTPLAEIVERFVYDSLLGLPVVDWNAGTKDDEARARAAYEQRGATTTPARKAEAPPQPARPLDAYAGTYTSGGYGRMVITREGDQLTVSVHSGTFPLSRAGDDAFQFIHPVEGQGWVLSFRGAPAGPAASVAIEAGPGLKPIVFVRE